MLTSVFTVKASETKDLKEQHKICQPFLTESNCQSWFERIICTCVILLSCFNLCWLYLKINRSLNSQKNCAQDKCLKVVE